jgi:hypothetical protein
LITCVALKPVMLANDAEPDPHWFDDAIILIWLLDASPMPLI